MSSEYKSRIEKFGKKIKSRLQGFKEKADFWFKAARREQEEKRKELEEEEKRILQQMEAIRRGEDPDPWKIQLWLREKRESLTENVAFQCENFNADPVERNHLIFIDGTGNDPTADYDGNPETSSTNVYRLYKSIDRKGGKQHAGYFPGVGSQADDPNPVSALFRQFGGKGADRIRDTAYMELIKAYHPGDKLFLFGFSRGAAIARMLANLIAEEGIPERGIARYIELSGELLVLDKVEIAGERRYVDIEVLGAWDTVAAFGIPTNQYEPFKNLTIARNIKKAYHLVAIDENRQPFQTALMNYAEHIEEIWFPGVHSDVGGGYGIHALSDITLQFMRNRLKEQVRLLEPWDEFNPNLSDIIHNHDKSLMPKKSREITVKGANRKPRIHKSAFERWDSTEAQPQYRPENLRMLKENRQYELDERD